jgi:L-glyceraldehyde 3-phosphate reductase
MTYVPAEDRYDSMPYRRCGRSGLKLPAISFGLWQNFGGEVPLEGSRAILRRAFDLGITHFDLANNYGPPYGSAEENFGRILDKDLRPWRDELVISTKAGYDMWPGPYGEWGSRKYLLASLDQSLKRMGLDYVDIFYSHRLDPDTPLEETLGALASAVHQGKALYAGISSYSAQRTEEAIAILRDLGAPLLIHQPSYSLLNRWIEPDLLDVLGREGVGAIVFSPLGQGLLTDRYLDGIPADSRPARDLGAHRREQRGPARGQRRRPAAAGLRRRRAGRDRDLRRRRRDQHLGALELGVRAIRVRGGARGAPNSIIRGKGVRAGSLRAPSSSGACASGVQSRVFRNRLWRRHRGCAALGTA